MVQADRTQLDSLLHAVHTLEPAIREHADEAERDGRLSPAVVSGLADAGIFQMYVPRSLGGLEVPPQVSYRVVEEVARMDGSTGWCVFIGGASSASFGAFLSDEAAEEIYGSDPRVITSTVVYPPGRAIVRDGGYVVSGRWPYASGIHHCAWSGVLCQVIEGDEVRANAGATELRFCFAPSDKVTIVDGSWNVSGLSGTGSNDIIFDEVFVPEGYSYRFGPGMVPGKHYQSPVYRTYPWVSLFAFPIAAVALGIAQGAIDTVTTLAGSKTPAGQAQTLRDRALFHFQLADAVALVESARAWLYSSIERAWEVASMEGRPASLEERGHLVLAAANATRSASRATDLAYTAAGGTANYVTSPLQRSLRNIHALTQHVATSPQQWERGGRMMVGLDPLFPLLQL